MSINEERLKEWIEQVTKKLAHLEANQIAIINGDFCDTNTEPKEPLIKDEKIRKVVRAWADINSLEHFTVINEHFNCCKIMGRKNNRVSKIEFLTTIPNTTHRTYTIGELCGEEEEC